MYSIFFGDGWTQVVVMSILSVLALSFVALVVAKIASDNAALRYGVLFAALIAALIVPIAGSIVQINRSLIVIPIARSGPSEDSTHLAHTHQHVDEPMNSGSAAQSISSEQPIASNEAAVESDAPFNADAGQTTSPNATDFLPLRLRDVLLTIWATGVGVGILMLLRATLLGIRVRRMAKPVDLNRIDSCVSAANEQVGLNALPMILTTDATATPVVHGLLRPAILIPKESVESLTDGQMTDVLIHEFAHVRRRDPCVRLLEALARCLYWPLIPIHWMIHEMDNTREEICDNYVIRQRSTIQYAETLLGLAEASRPELYKGSQILAVGILSFRGKLERRIEGILNEDRDRAVRISPWLCAMLLMSATASGVVVSATRLIADELAGQAAQEEFGPIGPVARALPTTDEEIKQAGTRSISVYGIAKDHDGKTVPGAKVFLVANSWQDKIIAETTSDDSGKYSFDDVAFPKKSGNASVFATANGYGITWHGKMSLSDPETIVKLPKHMAVRSFDPAKPVEMNLSFPKAATLFGIIHDGDGAAISNATISIRQLDYLDPTGKANHVNYREFNGLHLADAKYRRAKTDSDGKFKITDLPFQTYALLGVEHEDYATKSLYAAITDRRAREFERPSGSFSTIRNGQQVSEVKYSSTPMSVNPVRVRLHDTQLASIRVVDADGKPIAGMRISTSSSIGGERISSYGSSNENGIVKLKVPPGEHSLRIRPPRVTDKVDTVHQMSIVAGKDYSSEFTVPKGGILLARAIDASTGKPIEGVSLAVKKGNRTSGLNSVPHYVDHPKTDKKGELRALLPDGTHNIGIGFHVLPEPYRGDHRMRRIKIQSGKVTTEVFRLEKR